MTQLFGSEILPEAAAKISGISISAVIPPSILV